MTLDSAHVAVQHGNLPEPLYEALARLRRQTDFRHQHDCLSTISQHFVDGLHVDFGLAATGNSMQENRLMFSRSSASRT